MRKPTRDTLHEIPLSEAFKPGELTITMSKGQWDGLLKAGYVQGCVLLELDDDEKPTRAFQNPTPQPFNLSKK